MFRYQASDGIVKNGSFLLQVRFFGLIVGVLVLAICYLDSNKNLKEKLQIPTVCNIQQETTKK